MRRHDISRQRKLGILLFAVLTTVPAATAGGQTDPLRVIADTDTPVPGQGGATFQNCFQLNGVDPDISGRNIVFGACCPTGVYGWFDGELRVIANLDSTFPGTGNPLGFDFFDGSSPSISGENVAFSCRNGRPGPGAICAYINGELQSIALSAVTLVLGSSETFGTFFMLNGASPSISGENVAFLGLWGPELGVTGAGVYAYINGQLRVIADTTTFGIGGGGGPSISGQNVAFLGGGGVSAYINGDLRLIANGDTPAPGSTGTFGVFPLSPVISGQNIGFGAGAEGLGAGIFAYVDGELELIANRNTPVPGHEDTTFEQFFFAADVRPAISGKNVVFVGNGRLPGKQKQFVTGIYARIIEPPIPTVSTWSLIVLTLLLLSAGIVIVCRRREAACSGSER